MTSGAYRWDDRNHFPLGVSIQASIPLTRVFLSDGGAVAVNKRAWYRLVRIPVVVPLANPPRPSTSSHSAESETSDMGRFILVSAPRQVPLPASEKISDPGRADRVNVSRSVRGDMVTDMSANHRPTLRIALALPSTCVNSQHPTDAHPIGTKFGIELRIQN
jgi:hypothetical protein